MVGGWLHRHSCFVAANVIRSEKRRQARERIAVEMNALNENAELAAARLAPLLDKAVNELGEDDRTAILLRFYEQQDLRSIGTALGTNEDAAQKRVSRALDRLRVILEHRGVSSSAMALSGVLAESAVTAAPAGFAASVSASALAGASTAGVAAAAGKALLTVSRAKAAAAGTMLVAVAVAPILFWQHQSSRLNDANQQLQRQSQSIAQLESDRNSLSNSLLRTQENQKLSANELGELSRLRTEAFRLRTQKENLGKLVSIRSADAATSAANLTNSSPVETFPRETWTFAGRATPEATLQTMYWAVGSGNLKEIQACYVPELWSELEVLWKEDQEKYHKNDREMTAKSFQPMGYSTAKDFKIIRKEMLSDNEVSIEEIFDGKPGVSAMYMTNVAGEWKMSVQGLGK
jgi:hypothetical protein